MTTLGLNERVERVLAYAFGWISGLLLFLFEKNRNVRWHALQSMIVFGTLFVLFVAVNMLKWMLGRIWLLSLLTNFGLGLLSSVLLWVSIFLWVWLMVMAWLHKDYQLPFVSKWLRYIV
ncbi:MAG: hypothetical protein JO031_11485 [Ktedonobacteraceae bacterium]|nr:hypothetical protein [Ktedonobacteraceae bacterium]